MFGSSILDVAMGLVFVYLFLSLICSVITEWFSRFLSLRAVNLEEGIRKLLNDTKEDGLTQRLYNHPLIKGITMDGQKPSYISARFFSQALMDIIAHEETSQEAATSASASCTQSKDGTTTSAGKSCILTDFRAEVFKRADLPDDLKRTFLQLTHSADNDLKEARRNLEHWFDESMERVAGWYKRRAQVYSIIVAALVTLLLNADTFAVTKALYKDNTLRSSLVAASQEAVKSEKDNAAGAIGKINDNITNIQLPLGWPDTSLCNSNNYKGPRYGVFLMLSKLLGWLITIIAVSLGAPFWFDTLNKLANIRSAGKEPAKTKVKNNSATSSTTGKSEIE